MYSCEEGHASSQVIRMYYYDDFAWWRRDLNHPEIVEVKLPVAAAALLSTWMRNQRLSQPHQRLSQQHHPLRHLPQQRRRHQQRRQDLLWWGSDLMEKSQTQSCRLGAIRRILNIEYWYFGLFMTVPLIADDADMPLSGSRPTLHMISRTTRIFGALTCRYPTWMTEVWNPQWLQHRYHYRSPIGISGNSHPDLHLVPWQKQPTWLLSSLQI